MAPPQRNRIIRAHVTQQVYAAVYMAAKMEGFSMDDWLFRLLDAEIKRSQPKKPDPASPAGA